MGRVLTRQSELESSDSENLYGRSRSAGNRCAILEMNEMYLTDDEPSKSGSDHVMLTRSDNRILRFCGQEDKSRERSYSEPPIGISYDAGRSRIRLLQGVILWLVFSCSRCLSACMKARYCRRSHGHACFLQHSPLYHAS